MAFRVAAAAIFLCSSFCIAQSKIYDRCELAHELRDVHDIPEHHLATWLCITNYESHYNTSAHNPGSGDHGLFQISELYWCSPPGNGYACGVSCASLKDDDIENDVICAKRIHRAHQRMSGDGFTAWVVYDLHCRNPSHVASFLDGCFDDENLVKYGYEPIYEAMNLPTVIVPMPSTTTTPSPSSQPVSTTAKAMKTSSTLRKLQDKSTSDQKPATTLTSVRPTTPKPSVTVSTYKPLLNLSSRFMTSSTPSAKPSPPHQLNKISTYKPVTSTFKTTVKPTVPSRPAVSTYKPHLSTIVKPAAPPRLSKISSMFQRSSVTSVKPTTPPRSTISTYKPHLSTANKPSAPPRLSKVTSVKPSPPQQPRKISTYKPILSTFRPHSVTTPKPQISTYKPFLIRLSSVPSASVKPATPQQPNKAFTTKNYYPVSSFRTTTSKPTFSTYKPFLNQYSMSYKPQISTTKTPVNFSNAKHISTTHAGQRFSSTISTASRLTTFKPFTQFSSSSTFNTPRPLLNINNDGFNKPILVKPRETSNVLPFTLKSGVKPFEFKNNEKIYAFVNKSGYSFAISSHGFKLFRTGE